MFLSNGLTRAYFMDFGTWLDLREELVMLVITSTFLDEPSWNWIEHAPFCKLSSILLPLLYSEHSEWKQVAISRLMSEQSERSFLILSIFSLKKHEHL